MPTLLLRANPNRSPPRPLGKFEWPQAMLQEALAVLWSMGKLVVPRTTVDAVPHDPDDNRILEYAVEAQAQSWSSGTTTCWPAKVQSIPLRSSPLEFIELFLAP